MKKALVTGITGQDGAYLAHLLLSKGYKVYGAHRRSSNQNFSRLKSIDIINHQNLIYVELDLLDQSNVIKKISEINPDEIYNLAAQSFVGASFKEPTTTTAVNCFGPLYILEAIKLINKKIKFYQASTSEMFGKVQEIPQKETTQFYPRSPYGVSKLYSHWMTINYRESYDIFASSGILFNHESPLRGHEFVTRKITDAVAKISLGKLDKVSLGNLDAKRDWGFAGDYVEGMWRILNHSKPDTFILATNKTSSVREFLIYAFEEVDIEIEFKGSGVDEIGFNKSTGKEIVNINPDFFRPTEVDLLIGDPSKAENDLGWKAKTPLKELCSMMVKNDLMLNR